MMEGKEAGSCKTDLQPKGFCKMREIISNKEQGFKHLRCQNQDAFQASLENKNKGASEVQ